MGLEGLNESEGECESGEEEIDWLCYARWKRRRFLSPALLRRIRLRRRRWMAGERQLTFGKGCRWGGHASFFNQEWFEKETGVPTPNSGPVGGGFACPRQRGIWAAFV